MHVGVSSAECVTFHWNPNMLMTSDQEFDIYVLLNGKYTELNICKIKNKPRTSEQMLVNRKANTFI